jgi:hypothetical protein
VLGALLPDVIGNRIGTVAQPPHGLGQCERGTLGVASAASTNKNRCEPEPERRLSREKRHLTISFVTSAAFRGSLL